MANASWLGATANWNTPSDWSTGQIPGTADTAIISASGTYTVDVSSAAVAALALDDANATLAVQGSLAVAGTLAAEAGTLALSGALIGGTLEALGADVIFAAGTLDGVTYAGSLALSGSSTDLVIAGAFANVASGGGTGTIEVSAGAFLNLAFNTTLPALLGTVANSGGTLEISSTLNDAGQTLAVTPGGMFNGLLLAGVIEGGAIALEGGSLAYDGGTLDGVSVQGPLDLSADFSSIGITGGISLQSSGGGVDGVTVTGLLGGLVFLDNETLANASVTLGSDANQDGIFADASLTFGPSVSITEQGTLAEAAFDGAGTIANQGTITAAPADEVFIDAAGFTNASTGTIVVAAGGTLATADPVAFDNRGRVTAGVGAALDFAETSPLGNEGTFVLAGATMIAGSDVSGSGTVDLSAGAVFAADGSIAAQQVAFLDSGDDLDLARPAAFGGTISGFRQGDAIVLENTTLSSLGYAGGVLTAQGTIGGSAGTATFDLAGSYAAGEFTFTADGLGDTVIAVDIACFARGTRIATDRGEVAVEALGVGDRVLTAAGAARPIIWIGERKVDCRRHPRPDLVWPVRVSAGAVADGTPRRDLYLSPDHAVFAEGVLIPVRHLINGATIVQERPASVHYFHLELALHDVLLADGLPVESYLDTGNRAAFANGARHTMLHPDFAALSWDDACAPLATGGAPVAAIRRRLRERLVALTGLTVEAGGRAIMPAAVRGWLFQFLLPAGTREVRIVSRPGVRIGLIFVAGKPLALDSPALVDGVHPVGQSAAERWRWTDGTALLRLPDATQRRDPILLELLLRETIGHRPQPTSAAPEAA